MRVCANCGTRYHRDQSGAGRGRCSPCYQFFRRSKGQDNLARRMDAVLVAWEAGELSEGQAAAILAMPRIVLRDWRETMLERAQAMWASHRTAAPPERRAS